MMRKLTTTFLHHLAVSVDGPEAENAQTPPPENTVEVECLKAHEESDYYKQYWLSIECEIEEHPEMFWFTVISTVVFTVICIGSICGYNKNTSGRVCCKVCRCGSSPNCAYCCVSQIKCPQPLCSRCTCCIDELEDDDDDLESVKPAATIKRKRFKIVPLEKRKKIEKRAIASVTKAFLPTFSILKISWMSGMNLKTRKQNKI